MEFPNLWNKVNAVFTKRLQIFMRNAAQTMMYLAQLHNLFYSTKQITLCSHTSNGC